MSGADLRRYGEMVSYCWPLAPFDRQHPVRAFFCDPRIELYPERNFEHALEDLEGWERMWVLFCCCRGAQ